MASSAPSMGRHELETLIIERAWKDPDFRREFVSDPKGTIEKYSGQKLPSATKIEVHQEDANTMHMTIPMPPPNLNELTDADLERVAGGTDVVTIITLVATGAMLSGAATVSAAYETTRRNGW